MSNKDIDQARKLSNNEMEGQKGGATKSTRAFADLERFFVKPNAVSTVGAFRGDLAADSVMCAGQTRSGDRLNPTQLEQITQLRGNFTLKF